MKQNLVALLPALRGYFATRAPACVVEDLTQATCVKVLENSEVFDGRAPEPLMWTHAAWVLSAWRKRQVYGSRTGERMPRADAFEDMDVLPVEGDGLELERIALRGAFGRLAPCHQKALVRAYVESGDERQTPAQRTRANEARKWLRRAVGLPASR